MKNKLYLLFLLLPTIFISSCADLDEVICDDCSSQPFPCETTKALANVYLTLKGSINTNPMTCPYGRLVYAVQASTDELCIPVQAAGDWMDGGIYQDMQRHSWNANNDILLSAWNYCYNIISDCNFMLSEEYDCDLDNESKAELQTLRAYAYYRLIDLFGNVPLLTEENFRDSEIPQNTLRVELFKWIEEQLTYLSGTEISVVDNLADKKYGAMTKGVLNTLKARLYLNSKVFLNLSDASSEYEQYLEKAINACDAVINSGAYTLESNIFANWYLDNGPQSREIILAIPYGSLSDYEGNRLHIETLIPSISQAFGNIIGQDADGNDIIGGVMYANSVSGWQVNPGRTADDPDALINIFEENDNRRLAILSGQLYDRATYIKDGVFEKLTYGNWAPNDAQNPEPGNRRVAIHANLTPWFYDRGFDPALYDATKNMPKAFGARIIKFELDENPILYESPVDMIIMRYAEVLYTKAEALIRLGRNADAVPLFQQVLQYRGFAPMSSVNYTENYPFRDMDTDIYGNDKPSDATDGLKISAVALMSKRWLTGRTTDLSSIIPTSPDLEFMDKEWRREFTFEDRRRTDMIRMGKFAGPDAKDWGAHEKTTDPTRNLFPIPQAVRNANPLVEQNPGY